MAKHGLISNYTVAQYKVHKTTCNNYDVGNIVNREFNDRDNMQVIVSDLTYVRVAGRWHYICILVDLFNHEIIRYSSGARIDANLVYRVFASVKESMYKVQFFHTDRGN